MLRAVPTFQLEESLWEIGHAVVVGLDEVGRGPIAGPVAAAAVVFPPHFRASWLDRVRDSKQLLPQVREELAELIRGEARAWSVGFASQEVIDRDGIVAATQHAMREALAGLSCNPDYLLLDAFTLPRTNLPQTAVIKGDGLCFSVAAASIVAKVARDALMQHYDVLYPGYNFGHNKGYATADHLEALTRLGPCLLHRSSFEPVRSMLALGSGRA